MIDPDDVKQLVDAFMQTDAMQWVKTKMAAEADLAAKAKDAPPVDQNAMPECGDPNAAPGEGPPAADASPDGTPPAADGPPADSDAPPAGNAPPAGDDKPATPPAADGPPAGGEPPKEKDKYAMVDEKARYARIESDNKALKERLDKIESESRQKERYSKLESLRRDYAMNFEREVERTKGMTDDQFVSHLECIVENYSRIPIGATIHVPATVEDENRERYSRECAQEAMDAVNEARRRGDHGVSYEAALAAARAKRAPQRATA